MSSAFARAPARSADAAAAAGAVNAAGGLGSFAVSDLTRLRRFLILGAEGGTFYASERKLTLENAAAIARLIEAGKGTEVVAEILAVSLGGRAAKQTPTMFALAMVSRLGDVVARRAAYGVVPQVCRTPTMLFEFIELHMAMNDDGHGWGRGLRRAVAEVYCGKPADATAFAVTKYRQRNGWTHRDVLRLAHVKPTTSAHQLVLHYAAKGELVEGGADGADADASKVRVLLEAVEAARVCEDEAALVALIVEHALAREHLPSSMLGSVAVWSAMLPKMPLTALTRNLAKMTSIGLLKPLSEATATVVAKLTDAAALKRARVHPFSLLVALQTYRQGHGQKGSLVWEPTPEVVAALEEAFYLSFGAVTPTGKRYVLGLDVSGSMTCDGVAGSCVTPREASAAMAMVALRTEKRCHPMGFSDTLVPVPITAHDDLATVMRKIERIPMGGTDCALPMVWAAENNVEADVFIVYTDCETWAGAVTPAAALLAYREKMGIDAKLVVVAMTSGGFSIADPEDGGMLDVVGFDASAPQVMQEFVLGNV
jgi:60 kDa SS-A/Ro ribonucleoprotein